MAHYSEIKYPSPPTSGYKEDERLWIRGKWDAIRKAQRLADAANNDWQRINGEINRYLDDSGITDVIQRAKIKGESLALRDAFAIGNWHARNAERHIHDLQLFLKLKEMGLL